MLAAMGEMVIHVEMEFEHRLDTGRLARALDLVLDSEPVLGCRFVTAPLRVYWQRLPDTKRSNFLEAYSREEYEGFLRRFHDVQKGPQLKGCLWHDADAGRDRLLLKISHTAADAGGCKEAAEALAKIYNRLADDPDYLPEPNFSGSRGSWQVLRLIPKLAYPKIFLNYLHLQCKLLAFSKGFAFTRQGEYGGPPKYVIRHISAERVARIAEYRRELKATLNDMLMAAFFRAMTGMGNWDGKSRLQTLMTADLRQHYMPNGRAEGICSLSALEVVFPGGKLGHSFADTVKRMVFLIGQHKKNWLGLSDYIGVMPIISLMPACWAISIFGRLLRLFMRRTGLLNAMTNMGPISSEAVTFDKPATRAWLTVPPPRMAASFSQEFTAI